MFSTFENSLLAREIDAGMERGRRVLEAGPNCEDCLEWASDEFRPLDEIEPIGSSSCQNNCRCEIEIEDLNS